MPSRRILVLTALTCLACEEKATPANPPAQSSKPAVTTSAPVEESMSPKRFCNQLSQKITMLTKKCEERPETAAVRTLVKVSADGSGGSCETLKNVDIDVERVPACLNELKTWHDIGIVALQKTGACRSAFKGKTAVGARCSLDLECPDGSWCVPDASSDDPLRTVCSSKIEAGTACKEQAGESCGPNFYCAAGGKCALRPKAGEDCSPKTQHCAQGLPVGEIHKQEGQVWSAAKGRRRLPPLDGVPGCMRHAQQGRQGWQVRALVRFGPRLPRFQLSAG